MEAKDFREGNLIKINGVNKKVTITLLYEGGISEFCEFIPITKQWIVDFGLDEKWFRRPLMFHNIYKGYNIISNGHLIATIYYVHQLQNLFFALTGTELELKEGISACS